MKITIVVILSFLITPTAVGKEILSENCNPLYHQSDNGNYTYMDSSHCLVNVQEYRVRCDGKVPSGLSRDFVFGYSWTTDKEKADKQYFKLSGFPCKTRELLIR